MVPQFAVVIARRSSPDRLDTRIGTRKSSDIVKLTILALPDRRRYDTDPQWSDT
ncbi:hypothetical protein ASAP_2901 [Asaia bogorensis]|uniref:Uncharacterized protein n=1 Tax=Asaia bogorensis TaxID=91915 RepID=A0A060QLP7_9PROT|nr:hypothetical protein ASAP_2901 [Asaia bogorensis]